MLASIENIRSTNLQFLRLSQPLHVQLILGNAITRVDLNRAFARFDIDRRLHHAYVRVKPDQSTEEREIIKEKETGDRMPFVMGFSLDGFGP